jgi:hypothetical protein
MIERSSDGIEIGWGSRFDASLAVDQPVHLVLGQLDDDAAKTFCTAATQSGHA